MRGGLVDFPSSVVPAVMAFFDSLQFLALLFGNDGRHLPVSFCYDLVDAPAGVAPDLLELLGGVIEDWRDFRDLFRRQIKLSLQSLAHVLANHCAMMSH